MATEQAFWIVWCQGGGTPTVQHDEQGSAIREAERLARANPGKRFVVLESIAARVVDNMARITYEPHIPF